MIGTARPPWVATEGSAGVAPEVNLRIPLHVGDNAYKGGDKPWLSNPGQTSPKVQNGYQWPHKRTDVLQNLMPTWVRQLA